MKAVAGEISGCFPGVLQWMLCRTRSEPGKISRTRSDNSGERWSEPGSFREIRSYLRKESEEFLVLSFGDYEEFEAKGVGLRRNVSPILEQFCGSRKGVRESESGEDRVCCRKKIAFGQGEMELECRSQNSSPVSVLDLRVDDDGGDCFTSPDSSISEEETSKNKVLLEVEDESRNAGKYGQFARDLSAIWAHTCWLGEDDMNNSDWVKAKIVKSEEAKEIGFVVEQDIFDCLIAEAVFDMLHLYGTVLKLTK